MILVHGPDEPLVRAIVGHLTAEGQAAEAVPLDTHLFTAVVETKAHVVVGALTADANDQEALTEVTALVQASSAPRPPKVVLVAPNERDAEPLRLLRRSGAAYVIISRSRTDPPIPAPTRATVWLARDLLASAHARETRASLLRTIAGAIEDEAPVGVELAPEREPWDALLRAAGYRVRIVPNWLARAAAWGGQRALYVGGGALVSCLARRPRRTAPLLPVPRPDLSRTS